MEKLDFDSFLAQLTLGECVGEVEFYFSDERDESKGSIHCLGCLQQFPLPYWAGYCDIPNGCEFQTAEELVNAPIYNGRSLAERWEAVCFTSLDGMPLEEWLQCISNLP